MMPVIAWTAHHFGFFDCGFTSKLLKEYERYHSTVSIKENEVDAVKEVTDIEWGWTAQCPECATDTYQFDERVDDSGVNPVIMCECGCLYKVTCVEC